MKKFTIILVANLLLHASSFAQDYFEDIRGESTPITFNKKTLVSTRFNIGDNSIKANFFNKYHLHDDFDSILGRPVSKLDWGWGLSFKAQTEDDLGVLFTSGNITPGYSAGAYLSLLSKRWKYPCAEDDDHGTTEGNFRSAAVILFGSIKASQFQFANFSDSFSNQLSDSLFIGPTFGLSVVYKLHPGKDNIFIGASISANRTNTYEDLTKVEIKNDTSFSYAGHNRTVTEVNDNGDIYAVGAYKEYWNFKLRGNVAYCPGSLKNRIAFMFYPSVDFSKEYTPKYNLGFALNFLKKGSPTNTVAALLFEMNDLSNSKGSTDPFFKRSFRVGVTAAFNVLTGQ